MSQAIVLSIVIVDFKTTKLAQQLATKLRDSRWEVIVVDNNQVNRGFGGGINYGVSFTSGEYLLCLNSDVEIEPKDVQKLLTYLQNNNDVAVVGPQFVDECGRIVKSSQRELTPFGAVIGLSFLNHFYNVILNPPAGEAGLFHDPVGMNDFWLKSWDRSTTRDVAALNGACLMVRRADFIAVGGFDESFFLYWEENDLCQRIKINGKRITFLSEAKVRHTREVSVRQSDQNLEQFFKQSRALFLRKQFGVVMGGLISAWLWVTEEWRAIVLFGIALWLRIRDLASVPIIADVQRDYGQAVLMLQGKGIPLLGIPSSVPRFSQGPLNIWFAAFSFKLGGVSIYSPVILASVCTSLGAVLLYLILKKYVHKNIASLAGLMWVISPAAITQARMPFYLFAVPVFVLFFLQSLLNLNTHPRSTAVFLAVLAFCLLFQWELATIPFVAVLGIALWRNRIAIRDVWKQILVAALIGLSPQLLFDLTHRCQQLCQFVVWMGYRTVDVTGIDKRHSLTIFSSQFWTSVITQLSRVVGWEPVGLVIITLIVVTGIIWHWEKLLRESLFVYVLASFVFLFVGLIIHGDPSEAYFPPFIVLFPVLLAFSLDALIRK